MLNDKLVREVIQTHAVDTSTTPPPYKHVPLLEIMRWSGSRTTSPARWCWPGGAGREAHPLHHDLDGQSRAPERVMGAASEWRSWSSRRSRAAGRHPFRIVRFGNVLDSSGSVVQRIRDQIRSGGP
jgi:FlaA1/EpsC-like NDP-sugar epimerase